MRTLRGYVALGRFPVSMLDMPTEFSPIDSTAEAIEAFYLGRVRDIAFN